jgi:hypothetical protein
VPIPGSVVKKRKFDQPIVEGFRIKTNTLVEFGVSELVQASFRKFSVLHANLAGILGIFETIQHSAMDEDDGSEIIVFYESMTARSDVIPFVQPVG